MPGTRRYDARCALFIAILALASLLVSGCGLDSGNSASTNEEMVVNAGVATVVTTPAPIVPIAGPAVLGGRLGAFVRKFGSPNSDSDPSFDSYSFKRYSASNADYLRVVGDLGDGQQWAPYVYLIVVTAPPQQPWDSSSANALCASFLPQDARYVSRSLDLNKQGITQGVNFLYFSAALKATLPPSQFNDAQHNRVQSGLLDIYYSFVYGSQNSIDSCTLVPGTLAA